MKTARTIAFLIASAFAVLAAIALIGFALSGCAPPRCTAVRVAGAPTQTVFYAEVESSPFFAHYTPDAWRWPFRARELSRPHAVITGYADRRLRRGEAIVGDKCPGVLPSGEHEWTIERPKKGYLTR